MAITTSIIQTHVTDLGLAETAANAAFVSAQMDTFITQMKNARDAFYDNIDPTVDAEYDPASTYMSAIRSAEKNADSAKTSVPATLLSLNVAAAKALDTWSLAQSSPNNVKFRVAYPSQYSYSNASAGTGSETNVLRFPDAFRTLWRRAMNEELIVRVGSLTKGSGTWPGSLTSDQAITLATGLAIHGVVGNATYSVELTLTNSAGNSETVTVTIPANFNTRKTSSPDSPISVVGTSGSTRSLYSAITAIAITGGNASGNDGDIIEIWTK